MWKSLAAALILLYLSLISCYNEKVNFALQQPVTLTEEKTMLIEKTAATLLQQCNWETTRGARRNNQN